MADPRQRSKKRSSSKKLRKGFTLYLCHNLDYDGVVNPLQRNGIRFKRHRDFFSGDTPDTELLKLVGKRRWILLTFDQKQRTRKIENEQIKRCKVRQFVFTSSQIGDVGEVLLKALPTIRNICRRRDGPFVYSISATGKVKERTLG
jgi:PIN domain-containing protein